jgi:cobalt-zinc-cadmium efflux system outer membrane protein
VSNLLVEPLSAQEEALTLRQCVSLALEQNPLVLSARQEYRASLARVSQARALPQPSLSYDSDLQPSITNMRGSQESYLGIGASVPFPGKTYLRGQVAGRESRQVEAEVAALELDLTYEVNAAFYTLLLTREKVAYARQNLELSQDFVAKTELKFNAGDVPRVEVVRARVEAANSVSELRRAERDEDLARARMNFLLARPGSAPLDIAGELKALPVSDDLEMLKSWALTSRPEISGVESALEGASLAKTLGFMSYLPDIDLGVAQHRLEGEENTWQVTVGFELPLFFWQPARGEIREAYAISQALTEEATHLRNLISLEVEEAHREYLTAVNQIELMEEEILAQAEEVYEMYVFSYQEGEIGGIELIEAQRTLSEARKAYADSLYDYDIAIASLEKAVGRALGDN